MIGDRPGSIFYGCITLDGYLATRAHDLSWLYDTGTTEGTSYDAFYSHIVETALPLSAMRGVSLDASPYMN